MSPSPQLAPPGSSTYDSTRMHIGDGTWDQGRDTFLLPNLVGLNFETMRYNGMGNRFREFANYHSLIKAHGILAALTFLGIVPAAILIAKFYHRNPRAGLRLHIMLQILTVALSTVILILGWQAVGPPRSLTNPHHGIGLAIYVLILVQAIGGGLMHHVEKKKDAPTRLPLKVYLHQQFGRAIALLGIIQVALGLTLYGSPKYLFILYALVTFALFLTYLILSFRFRPGAPYDDRGSYMYGSTTDVTPRSHRRPGLGALAAAGAAGAGLAALGRRRSSRNRLRKDHSHHGDGTVVSSHHSSYHSGSYDEKWTDDERTPHKDHTWRNRLLGGAAGVGALAALRGLIGGRKHDRDSDVGSYAHPLGGAHTITDVDSRVEEGNAPITPDDHWRKTERLHATPAAGAVLTGSPTRPNRIRRHRRSGESISSSSSGTRFTGDPDPRRSPTHHGLRDGVLALGVLGYLKHTMSKRKEQREEQRISELRERDRLNSERINRAASKKHRTAGGSIPPISRPHRPGSLTDSEVNHIAGGNLPGQAGVAAAAAGGIIPPIPMPPPGMGSRHNVTTTQTTTAAGAVPVAAGGDLQPPRPLRAGSFDSSGSEAYTSPGGGHHHRHRGRDAAVTAAAAATGAAVGAAVAGPSGRRTNSRHRDSSVSMADPPVSVKVKMHQDGRHVTLKRLTEEEAAAERESRRRERQQRRHRGSSLSSLGGSGDERWRRTEAREQAEAQQQQQPRRQGQHNVPPPGPPALGAGPPPPTSLSASNLPGPPPGPPPPSSLLPGQLRPAPADGYQLPPPPPIPASGLGSHGSPQSTIGPYGTGTETDSKADSNRRRRRAERARARQGAAGGSGGGALEGGRVEFRD